MLVYGEFIRILIKTIAALICDMVVFTGSSLPILLPGPGSLVQ